MRERLIARFFELGRAGTPSARESYASHGLNLGHRGLLGLALQRLLEQADAWVQETKLETAAGEIWRSSFGAPPSARRKANVYSGVVRSTMRLYE